MSSSALQYAMFSSKVRPELTDYSAHYLCSAHVWFSELWESFGTFLLRMVYKLSSAHGQRWSKRTVEQWFL